MGSQPWLIISVIYCLLQLCAVALAKRRPIADRITRLPGQTNVSFQQYAGYITVDERQERSYFYYFVEAETKHDSKPLVLWLNGGPGCSSVGLGAFSEHGPFSPHGNVLVRNNFSWNKAANMLYLESPAGVGFSYSTNISFYENVNDDITARDNLIFLQKWVEEYPEFKNSDLYITGESYGGHYVPQLAKLIASKASFKLKGIAIGNPLLDYTSDFNSRAEFLWSHGLISDSTYDQLTFVCNYSQIRRQASSNTLTPVCLRVANLFESEMSRFVNIYDVTLDVCVSSVMLQSKVLNKWQDGQKIDVCVDDETYAYLNRKVVQTALHASLLGVKTWETCSDVLQYDFGNEEVSTIGLLGWLVKRGIRVLVYSGDQDSILPLTSTRKLVHGLATCLRLNTTQPYRAWFQGEQVAGWTQAYGNLLSFATVRGAAHEVPFSQPERGLVLFSSFVGGKPLPAAPARN